MSLTREQILSATDLSKQTVDVPEWGGTVTIQAWTGTQRDTFEAEQSKDTYSNLRARLVSRSVVDETGTLLFTPANIEALGKKSGAALDRIVEAVYRINKYSSADRETLEKTVAASPAEA